MKEIEATDAGINSEGFMHIKGCEKLDRIMLNKCSYITDEAIQAFELRKDSLKVVEIMSCKNITDEGLVHLKKLSKLEKLVIHDLPYVKNAEKAQNDLKEALKNCVVDIKEAE